MWICHDGLKLSRREAFCLLGFLNQCQRIWRCKCSFKFFVLWCISSTTSILAAKGTKASPPNNGGFFITVTVYVVNYVTLLDILCAIITICLCSWAIENPRWTLEWLQLNNFPPLTNTVGNRFKTRRCRSRNNSREARIILENYIYLCLHFPNRYKPVNVAHFCFSK